jgi:EAL domain-containing protein (putative c-di-GMP-specific phosphodiesterase class I)
MDRLCLETVVRSAADLPGAPRLTVNLMPELVALDAFLPARLERLCRSHELEPRDLTVEVAVTARDWNVLRLAEPLHELARRGIAISIDDAGFGDADLEILLGIRPRYLKLDPAMAMGFAADASRQAVVAALVHLGGRIGFRVVAEGVERQADLEALFTAGVTLMQGRLLGRLVTAAEWRRGIEATQENRWDRLYVTD